MVKRNTESITKLIIKCYSVGIINHSGKLLSPSHRYQIIITSFQNKIIVNIFALVNRKLFNIIPYTDKILIFKGIQKSGNITSDFIEKWQVTQELEDWFDLLETKITIC